MTLLSRVPTNRLVSRAALLLCGLGLYGFSDALLVRAGLGLDPWDVLHQGMSRTFGLQVGTWSIVVGALVLLMWIPLRQRPGVGTICNIVTIGLVLNLTLAVFPTPHEFVARSLVMIIAVGLNGLATGAYIGAGLGPGPRDGLSTGVASRGVSLRIVRTSIELGVLIVGWSLGGAVGVGTVVYALCIGPITHLTIPALRISPDGAAARARSRRPPIRGSGVTAPASTDNRPTE